VCRYSSENFIFNIKATPLQLEIEAVLKGIESFEFFLRNKPFTLRTDCQVIVKFYNKKNEKWSYARRWVDFQNILVNHGHKIIIEHIKGDDNNLADYLSRKLLT
jgi:Reverse transcriptase-like